jgi:hypothetical protein
MVEPVAQPPECVPGDLVGNLSVDLLVSEIRLWRRMTIAMRECTSSAARSEPQVRRVSWSVMRRTRYRAHSGGGLCPGGCRASVAIYILCYVGPVIVRDRDFLIEDLPQMRQEPLVLRGELILLAIIR